MGVVFCEGTKNQQKQQQNKNCESKIQKNA
jgi:hypothetical protein